MKPSLYLLNEMRTGTEKLAEALLLRGFPVEVKADLISLRNGSRQDYDQLKAVLETLNIPVFWNGDQFQLLINNFPNHMMKKIIEFQGHEHEVHMEGYHFKWRSFVTRRFGVRTNTMNLCPYTAILVKALNEAGIVTLTGCNGHGHHNPNTQLSGVYQGVWLSIIQQKYLKNLSLHYGWKVQFMNRGCNALFIANKRNNETWNMKKVLADCYAMASVLMDHASEIREWKRRALKRNMKLEAECLREKGDIRGLYEWMKNKADSIEALQI